MKKIVFKSILAITFFGLMTVACSEKDTTVTTPDDQTPVTETTPEYSFIPVEQWLPGTEWTVRRIYKKFGSCTGSWLRFRMAYDETQYGNAPGANCRDTFYFGEGTYSVYGRENHSREYCVADSVVILGNFQRVYQISADSLIMYGWFDCNATTEEIKAWLFTKIQ